MDKEIQVVSRRDFKRVTGLMSAPVALTGDMSDYVRVTKDDLCRALEHYGLDWVEYFTDAGEVFFVGAHEARPEGS